MTEIRSRSVSVGAAIIAAVILFAIAAVAILPLDAESVFGEFKDAKDRLSLLQLVVSFFGFIGAISAFSFAIFQYRRSERWKRMEFIAREVKEFEADPTVQNALLIIDWGTRSINLFQVSDPKKEDFVVVTREVQWRALLPHKLKQAHAGYQAVDRLPTPSHDGKDAAVAPKTELTFSNEEAKIRDTYDVFLTRLDRMSTFIRSKLITAAELEPFIDYWIDAMTTTKGLNKDAEWKATLLTYINFYGYDGVNDLFSYYKKDLSPNGDVYQKVLAAVKDRKLAERLEKSLQ